MISPQKFTRDWKQILKAGLRWLLHIWSVVFSFLPFLSYITEQLNIKPLKTHKQPCKKEENTTLCYTNSWIHKCSLQWQGVQEWHTVCQLESRSIFVPFSFITFSLCSVRLKHFTIAQSHPNWLAMSSTLGVCTNVFLNGLKQELHFFENIFAMSQDFKFKTKVFT